MGMTIDESLSNLKELQKDYQQFYDDVWQDPEAYGIMAESLKVAIETMRKYQKIQEILNSTSYTENNTVYFYTYDARTRVKHIREVIENGNDD